ncbi:MULTISPECIES: carbohydrate ABC transporter permease [Eisenbergiella]|uniref:Carbohydrate ABC transporter permease n=1 Tax=Eisenbergiella porci TaxID=2652274 RepID=A0A6N7WNX4_9FIRM|nr:MULTISPECIES: carbohydrate ABC transporter permease [Eisenbergiella]MDY2652307.1 carbohydrate ABC transporter permease [Eisenbergiella porci]MSS91158.1 carbohydrate ABC transporter permease [Eisenbergiella porci]
MKKKKITQDKVVYFINYVLLALLLVIVLYPIIYNISCSFSSGSALMAGRVRLLPVEFTFDSYKAVFKYQSIWSGYKNSVIYTIVGTLISIVFTLFAAYPLSRDDFRGQKLFTGLFLFTMMFSGGLIPTYLLVRNLKLIDTMWAIVLPGAVSAYNMIVARTFFKQTIPKELMEAAEMDGCSDFKFFSRIVIPLSTPIVAVLCLWVAVSLWNSYFNPMIYINSEDKYPLQLVLRRILLMSQVNLNSSSVDPQVIAKNQYLSEMLKYGTIIISTLPLMVIYPFVQKYFVKGVMIGSVKG